MILETFEINDDQADEIVVAALQRTLKIVRDPKTHNDLFPDWKELSAACQKLLDYYTGADTKRIGRKSGG